MSHRKTKKTFVKESASKSSTRASYIKNREISRGLNEPSEPSDMGIGEGSRQRHISIDVSDDPMDPMDMDDIDDSSDLNIQYNCQKGKRHILWHL